MKVLIFDTADMAYARTANQIIAQINAKSDSVLGLATGGTMVPVYQRLVAAFQRGELSFANARSFNLDEYVGLAPSHPCSYHFFMQQHLFGPTDFVMSNTFLPNGYEKDPQKASADYEELLLRVGPIDLQILGIGSNGHIGFNEPTSSLGSRTRIKTLTKATREANQRFFNNEGEPPEHAITMGVQTILESREILILATGGAKSEAVAAMIEGPVGAKNPASILQMHPTVTIVVDAAAAERLTLKEYYFQTHPNGEEALLN